MAGFTETDRKLYFLGGCIPTRIAIAYLVYHVESTKKPVVPKNVVLWGVLLISLALLFAHVKRLQKQDAKHTGFFGSVVYWDNSIHAFMYAICAFMIDSGYKHSWVPLALDVLIGLGTFYMHYFQ